MDALSFLAPRHLPERHTRILDAAIACFVNKGFQATSMRDIAHEADVSLGNLYTYFSGKDALIAAVAMRERTELEPLMRGLIATARPSPEVIKAFLHAYRNLCSQRDWALMAAECAVQIARSPDLAAQFANNSGHLVDILADALIRGQQANAFHPVMPTRLIAQVLLDAVENEAWRTVLLAPPQGVDDGQSPAGSRTPDVPPPALDTAFDSLVNGLLRGLLGAA